MTFRLTDPRSSVTVSVSSNHEPEKVRIRRRFSHIVIYFSESSHRLKKFYKAYRKSEYLGHRRI